MPAFASDLVSNEASTSISVHSKHASSTKRTEQHDCVFKRLTRRTCLPEIFGGCRTGKLQPFRLHMYLQPSRNHKRQPSIVAVEERKLHTTADTKTTGAVIATRELM